jgi:hypothetical protein
VDKMANYRSRTYYPDNFITKNLFTSGKEWMKLEDWSEYIGSYHQYITGETYTESEWNPMKSVRLTRYKERGKSYFKYVELKQYIKLANGQKKPVINPYAKYDRYTKPQPIIRIPTDDEFKVGNMTRHFAYKATRKKTQRKLTKN